MAEKGSLVRIVCSVDTVCLATACPSAADIYCLCSVRLRLSVMFNFIDFSSVLVIRISVLRIHTSPKAIRLVSVRSLQLQLLTYVSQAILLLSSTLYFLVEHLSATQLLPVAPISVAAVRRAALRLGPVDIIGIVHHTMKNVDLTHWLGTCCFRNCLIAHT